MTKRSPHKITKEEAKRAAECYNKNGGFWIRPPLEEQDNIRNIENLSFYQNGTMPDNKTIECEICHDIYMPDNYLRHFEYKHPGKKPKQI